MAPEPRDINWDNLVRHNPSSPRVLFRRTAASVMSWAITVLWILPSSYIYTLTVGELVSVNGFLGSGTSHWIVNLVTSTLPTLLTSMQQIIVPYIFHAITALERPPTYSALEENVLKRYYRWAFINIFVLFMFARVIGVALLLGVQNPAQVLLLLARYLPEGATFFINFVLFCTCLHSLELLQLGMPLLSAFFVTSSRISKSPRQLYKNTFPLSFPYFYYYPNHTLIFCLSIIYSTVNPLILFAGSIYFAFANIVFRYQFAFAYVRKYEKAGRLWMQMVRHVIGGLMLFQLMMVGLMLLKGSYGPLVLLFPLFIATVCFNIHWNRTFLRRTKFMSLDTGLQVAPDLDEGHIAADGGDGDSRVGAAPISDFPTTTAPENHMPRDVRPGAREGWGRRIIEEAEALEVREAAEAAASGFAGLSLPRISRRSPAANHFRRSGGPSDPDTSSVAALATGAFGGVTSSLGDPDDPAVEQASVGDENKRADEYSPGSLSDAKPTLLPPPRDPHHIQDESSANQAYTHPCLIEPLPTLLWLPLNPLNPNLDLDHTTQIGQAIVSSEALKGTGRFRTAEKFRREGAAAAAHAKRTWSRWTIGEGVLATAIGSIGIAMGVSFGREMAEDVIKSRDRREIWTDGAEPRPPPTSQTRRRRRRSASTPVLSPSPSPASIRRPEVGLLADSPLAPASVSRGGSPLRPSSADAAVDLVSFESPRASAVSAANSDSSAVPDVDILEGGGSAASVLSRPASAPKTDPGAAVARA